LMNAYKAVERLKRKINVGAQFIAPSEGVSKGAS
jgi:hypothetical protein